MRSIPDISGLTFVTRQMAYEQIKADLEGRPELLDSVKPENMPESYDFKRSLRADEDAESFNHLANAQRIGTYR